MNSVNRLNSAATDPPGFDSKLEMYLDGLMSEAEREVFERERGGIEALRDVQARQEELDAQLLEHFCYEPRELELPASPRVAGKISEGGVVSRTREPRVAATRRWWLAAAAMLVMMASVWSVYTNIKLREPAKFVTPERLFAIIDQPEFVCTTDAAFAKAVKDRLGQALVLLATPGIVADGWAYGNDYEGNIVGEKTLVLIAHVRGEKVLVLMDRARDDRVLERPTDPGLNIFRAENGGLVLYEITRLAQPEVIGRLVDPDKAK